MFFHVGIVIAAYAGVRVFEAISNKFPSIGGNNVGGNSANEASLPLSGRAASSVDLRVKAQKPEIENTLQRAEQKHLHYANASMLSTGLLVTRNLLPAAGPLGFVCYAYSVLPEMRRAERSLIQDRQITADLAFVSLNMLTLSLGWYSTTAFSLWMMYSGKSAHVSARRKLNKGASHFFTDSSDTVWVIKNAVELEIPVDEVKVNDFVVLSEGLRIPFDGVLHEGQIEVNQYILTGELQPVEKGINAPVYANTVVVSGRAVIRVVNNNTADLA